MSQYMQIANSSVVFWLSVVMITVVILQSLLFIRKAYQRGIELDMSKADLKRAMTSSAVLSIVPSLPIIVMMLALSVPLGKYFPWQRLSIVGSAAYDGMAANIAAQSLGFKDISDSGLTPEAFVLIMFVMTIGIIWGIVFNILLMPRLDQLSKKMRNNAAGSHFIKVFTAALFTAMMIVLSTPYVGNVSNGYSSIIAFVTAGVSTLICQWLATKTNQRYFRDFSLPISLIVGMAAVIIQANLF